MTTTETEETLSLDQVRELEREAERSRRVLERAPNLDARARDWLEARALSLEAEVALERERLDQAAEAQNVARRRQWDMEAASKARHAAALRERAEEAERLEHALEWFKGHARHGWPVPKDQAVQAAAAAGIQEGDLIAVTKGLRRTQDGTECLGLDGPHYLRRDFASIE